MSVNKDFFQPGRDFNYDFESAGKPAPGWRSAARVPELLVPTHCAFCGVQCGMYLKVADGQVIGVESRNFPHNRGSLCPKGVVAYQQVNHPERLRYPMIGRCTHLSCAVYYDQARGTLVCPCHEGIFDPQTGAPLAGPPQRSLPKIALQQEGSTVYAVEEMPQ